MSPKISLNDTTLKILYAKHKLFLIPCGIIFICIILLFTVIIPQIQEFFSLEAEIKTTREKLIVLKENVRFLSGIAKEEQDRNVQSASAALPSEKDYVGIIGAVSAASVESGVFVDDFSFSVGNIAETSQGANQNPPISFTLRINGSIEAIRQFVEILSKSFPLSEVQNIQISGNSASLTIYFYYKGLPSIQIDYALPFMPLSKQELSILQEIDSW